MGQATLMSRLDITEGSWESQEHFVKCNLDMMLKGNAAIPRHKPHKAALAIAAAQGCL